MNINNKIRFIPTNPTGFKNLSGLLFIDVIDSVA